MIIPVKDAVKIASTFFIDLFPKAIDLRLEEVELSEEGPWWEVTFSFDTPPGNSLAQVLGQQRTYKTVRVDRDSGEPRAVRVRKL